MPVPTISSPLPSGYCYSVLNFNVSGYILKEYIPFAMAWMELESIYAKWNKPGGEGKIPYDLTFNWNVINKRKKQTKYDLIFRSILDSQAYWAERIEIFIHPSLPAWIASSNTNISHQSGTFKPTLTHHKYWISILIFRFTLCFVHCIGLDKSIMKSFHLL